MCKDLEYLIRSMPFFKKIIIRRVSQGAGKLSINSLKQWYKLEAEQEFVTAKEGLEMAITSKMNA